MSDTKDQNVTDINKLKTENIELKNQNDNLNVSLKNLNAQYVALQQGHDFFVKDGQQIRTLLVLEQQKLADLDRQVQENKKVIMAHEAVNKQLTEELNKLKEAQKPASTSENVATDQAA